MGWARRKTSLPSDTEGLLNRIYTDGGAGVCMLLPGHGTSTSL